MGAVLILQCTLVIVASVSPIWAFTSAPVTSSGRVRGSAGALKLTTLHTNGESKLLSAKDYDTIQSGRITVIPNYIPPQEMLALRTDAQDLHAKDKFSTDALAAYGSSGSFDPGKDRAVLRLTQWKDESSGNWGARLSFGRRMAALRADLAYNLNRPRLNSGLATTSRFGNGSTEISYTRFGPGAFLKRHVDEHHEELKGTAGWSQPTRRSVSWLVYLNESWNGRTDGGQLRCFERSAPPASPTVGARPNGDLQVAWLRASSADPVERPVYLDGRRPDHACSMYIVQGDGSLLYITKDFDAHPILYVAGGEALAKKLLLERRDLAERFHFIEPPKSKIGDLLKSESHGYAGSGEDPASDELLADIDPIGGTLVLFDSVSLPHEVLATKNRERWATSGWFHEDQQLPKAATIL